MKVKYTLITSKNLEDFGIPFVAIEDDPSLAFVEDAMTYEEAIQSMIDGVMGEEEEEDGEVE